MELGKKIKYYRMELELSQEELAEKLATSRQTISSWENGKTYPSLRAIITLSELFGISIDHLTKEDIRQMKAKLAEQKARISRKKDREVLNRMVAIRLFNGTVGIFLLFIFYRYLPLYWLLIPISMLLMAVFLTIIIEKYRKKYNLTTYEKIVAFFDEKYLN